MEKTKSKAKVAVKTRRKMGAQGLQLVPLVKRYVKTAIVVLSVWVMGYYRVSYSWVMMGIFAYVSNSEYRKAKEARKQFAEEAVIDEQGAILARTDELPSWVYFPDVERAEWVNKILKQMWPYIGQYASNSLKASLEESIQNSMPSALSPFKFLTIDLGSVPPRIGGVKVYVENVKRDEIYLDVELFFASESNIVVAVKGMQAGIKDLTVQGTLRVAMKPLIPDVPIIGAMNFFFLNPPSIDFNLTKFANMLDVPLLSQSLRTVIEDQISYYMVLPNMVPYQLAADLDPSLLKKNMPQGVIRIHIEAGRELKRADISLLRRGKSDPYCKVYVGAQFFETKVIKDTITPKWNQYFEAVVDQMHGQFVEIEVMDKDPGEDDSLGSASVDIELVAKEGKMDSWLPLENVKTGMIHVRCVWLHLSKEPGDLATAVNKVADIRAADHLAVALLLVTLDSASGLKRTKKSMQEPSPYATLTVGNCEKKSNVQPKTSDPNWEEYFQFLVHDPKQQDLEIEILDQKSNKKGLGSIKVPLKDLLQAEDMTVNRPYTIDESGGNSQIHLHLCLRILTTDLPGDWSSTSPPVPEDIDGADVDDVNDDDQPTTTNNNNQEAGGGGDATSDDGGGSSLKSPLEDGSVDAGEEEIVEATQAAMEEAGVRASTPGSDKGLRKRTPAAVRESTGSLDVGLGRVQVTIRYSSQRSRLILVVHKCQGLLACDSDDFSDPYVRIYLLPDRSSSSKRKTEVVRNNLNPIFDETFEWPISEVEASSRTLEMSVKNSVGVFSKARTHIGEAHIDLSHLDLTTATTQWYELEEPTAKDSS